LIFDDGIKLWPLGQYAVGGFAGDVELAEAALFSLRLSVEEHRWQEPEQLAKASKNWLRYWRMDLQHTRQVEPTRVLLAVGSQGQQRFSLYRLDDHDNFKPNLRDGVIAIGSGEREFGTAFEKEIGFATTKWAEPYNFREKEGWTLGRGPKGEVQAVAVRENYPENVRLFSIANFLLGIVDELVRKADLADVGGLCQPFILSPRGLQRCGAKRLSSSDGEWHDVTADADDLRSYSEMFKKKYSIPRMQADCTIRV